MLLSVVVPAFNESKLLECTLRVLERSVTDAGLDRHCWELVVCDNASTDGTAQIASELGARVVCEPHRQIARARNTGATAARGEWLLFVDADTWPSAGLIAQTLHAIREGRVCGGGSTLYGGGVGPCAGAMIAAWNGASRALRLACGAYLFCRADAFAALGGFDSTLYAAEELEFSNRLKRWGRRAGLGFVILSSHPLRTSLRKLELYSAAELAAMSARALLRPRRAIRDRRYLGAWYDGRR